MLDVKRRDWAALERGASKCREWYQELLTQSLPDGPPWQLDEVALAFATADKMQQFVEDALEHGWAGIGKPFATDYVDCEPLTSSCSMEYCWLNPMLNDPRVLYRQEFAGEELVITNNWRVECVRVMNGYNPLLNHWRWMVGAGGLDNMGWIHVAFKVPSLDIFEDARYTLARRGWQEVQHCRSGYGQFAYFRLEPERLKAERTMNEGLPFLYLKVRVNLRDKPRSADQ
jgi:hypothetical protein